MSKQSSRGPEWEKVRRFVLQRDGYTCTYCGKQGLTGKDATADHVIPKDAGGTDDPSNLVAACRRCNGSKSNRLLFRSSWNNPRWLPELTGSAA